MKGTAVLTSQNVLLFLNSNVLLWRFIAYLIDIVILIAYVYVLGKISDNFGFLNEDFSLALFLLSLPVFFYSLITEFLMNGRTIGKFITGIRVVKINGLKCGYTEYLLRWLFRMIDIYPFFFLSFYLSQFAALGFGLIGIPAFLFIATSKNHQRLGDIVAGTTVIKINNKVSLSSTIFKEVSSDYEPEFPQVVKLSDNDMRIIKDTYLSAKKHRKTELIHKLRVKVQDVMQVESNLSDEDFLDIVINDFNHYTKDM